MKLQDKQNAINYNSPTSAVFFNNAIFETSELPPVSCAIRAKSQGVASLPVLLTPFSSDSRTACVTNFCICSPADSYSSGIGTAINAPFCKPSCHWVSENVVLASFVDFCTCEYLQRNWAAVAGSSIFQGTYKSGIISPWKIYKVRWKRVYVVTTMTRIKCREFTRVTVCYNWDSKSFL